MYRCAKPEKKKQAGGLLLSATLACMMTGITEPLEFSFLLLHRHFCCTGSACRFCLHDRAYPEYSSRTYLLWWFSGSVPFRYPAGNAKTSWLRIIPVGIIYFFLYYFIFSFLIKSLTSRHRDVKMMIQRQNYIQRQM